MTDRDQDQRHGVAASEWVVAAVSALVIAATVGYVLYKAMTAPDTPPIITVEVSRVVETDGLYVVEFWAHNHGGETASDLTIAGEVVTPEGDLIESEEMTFNFVPSESRRRGGIFFTADPREHELLLRPVGYDLP